MTTDELLQLVRSQLRDHNVPYKWDDQTIVLYLNEAQEKVCRATLAFIQSNESLPLTAGVSTYDLPEYVQHVYRVHLDGSTGTLGASTDDWTPVDGQQGTPTRYTLDSDTHAIRFWPTPDADTTAVMRVAQFPTPLTIVDMEAQCELLGKYQLALVDWAAYRCFTHDDADGRSDGAAKLAKDRYEESVADHRQDLYRFRTGSALRVSGNRVRT